MPHKHTRREKDPSTFDLPPSQIAAPLPATAPSQKAAPVSKAENGGAKAKTGAKRKRGATQKDDAPRAFKRLMAFAGGKKVKSGLDDGKRQSGKKQTAPDHAETSNEAQGAAEFPTINPGERMSDFAARVDAALPLGGLVSKTKNGKDPLGMRVWRTRKEKKMQKLYDEWREEDRKIKERKADELELAEERELEDEDAGVSWQLNFGAGEPAGKKKGRKGKAKEEDPWEELKRKRAEAKVGLHDVAQAPPKLQKTIASKLLVRGAAVDTGSIPKSAGSLRRREELAGTREAVIASYRRRAEERRPKLRAEKRG